MNLYPSWKTLLTICPFLPWDIFFLQPQKHMQSNLFLVCRDTDKKTWCTFYVLHFSSVPCCGVAQTPSSVQKIVLTRPTFSLPLIFFSCYFYTDTPGSCESFQWLLISPIKSVHRPERHRCESAVKHIQSQRSWNKAWCGRPLAFSVDGWYFDIYQVCICHYSATV